MFLSKRNVHTKACAQVFLAALFISIYNYIIQVSINRKMDRRVVVYSYSRIPHSNRKEQTIDTHCTQKHADRKKQGTKVSLHDSIKSGSIKSGSINQVCNDRNKISVEKECLQRGLRELWGVTELFYILFWGFICV